MQFYSDRVTDQYGNVKALASVSVLLNGLPATIYSDDGVTTQANPITTASDGSFSFYAANGTYTLSVSDAESQTVTLLDYTEAATATPLSSSTVLGETGGVVQRYSQKDVGPLVTSTRYATGLGVADDTTGLQSAIAALASTSHTSTLAEITRQRLFITAGIYKVSDFLTADTVASTTYLTIEGENSILALDPGVVAFGGLGTRVTINDLHFHGGAGAASIKTNNTDVALIVFNNCSFLNWTGNCIAVDNDSASTKIIFNNCRFQIPLGTAAAAARVLYALSGDNITFNDCWVSHKSSNAAFYFAGATLNLNRLFGVPMPDVADGAAILPAWVDNYGSVYCDDCRFGGEGSGPTVAIVRNYAASDVSAPIAPTVVSIKGGQAYTGGALLHLYAIPNVVEISGVTGLVDTDPVRVDSAVATADKTAIGNLASIFRIDYNSNHYSAYIDPLTGAPSIARELLPRVHDRHVTSQRPAIADLLLQFEANTGGYGPASARTTTASNPVDIWGITALTETATADDQYFTRNYTTALTGLASAIHTAVFDVTVSGSTVRPLFKVATVQTQEFALPAGKHTICIPFWYESGLSTNLGLECYGIPNGTAVTLSKVRVYAGRVVVQGTHVEMDGAAAPVSGQFYIGDTVYIPPVAGSFMGHVCTAAGTPGTWKTFGAVSA